MVTSPSRHIDPSESGKLSATVRVARRRKRRPCGDPPAVPTGVVITAQATEARTHLEFSGKVKFNEVTLDEGGLKTQIRGYEVQLRATDVAGVPVETEDSRTRLRSRRKQPARRIRADSATNPSGTTYRIVTHKAHGFVAGDKVELRDFEDPAYAVGETYDGLFTIVTVVNPTTFEVSGTFTGLPDCDDPGVVIDDDDRLHVIIDHFPRPKIWYWQARVRAVDVDDCRGDWSAWTTPLLPWTGADPTPPAPTFTDPGAVTFDRVNRDRHTKLRALFTFAEVTDFDYPGTPADDEEDVAFYRVQMDRSDDGVTWDGAPYRTRVVPAKNEDADTTRTVIFPGIRRRYWYRFRVGSIDRFMRRSVWSTTGPGGWSTPALPFDDTQPPRPNVVTVFQKATDRIVVKWTNPTINVATRGTVAGTIGTSTVTGTGTKFTVEVEHGNQIKINGNAYLVKSVASDTSLTVVPNLVDSPSGAALHLVVDDPDIARSKVQIAKAADVDQVPTPDVWSAVYDSKRTRGEQVSFKIPDADRGETFYARVQSIDAGMNHSKFVPATLAGNSDPDVNGDGIKVGRRHRIAVTFTKNGTVVAKLYPQGWPCPDERYNIVGVRARVGAHESGSHPNADGCPTGSDMEINLRVRDDSTTDVTVFTSDNRLKIAANTHKDTSWITEGDAGFNRTYIDSGESLYMKVINVGSTNPGEDLTVTVLLEPVA